MNENRSYITQLATHTVKIAPYCIKAVCLHTGEKDKQFKTRLSRERKEKMLTDSKNTDKQAFSGSVFHFCEAAIKKDSVSRCQ